MVLLKFWLRIYAAEVFGDCWMVAFDRQSQRRLAIVGNGVRVGLMRHKELNNFEVTISGSRQQWRIACGGTMIRVCPVLEKPPDNFSVATGYRARQRRVAGSVRG